MACIVVENFWNRGKRLVKLRRHLHKVASHTGTAQTIVLAIGEQSVQGVTKLVEHRRHLIPGNQRGLTLGSLSAIAYIKYNRQLVPLTALLLESVHPCTTTLRRTTVVVGIEESERLAVLVNHLEGFHVRMIGGNVRTLLERKAIHAIGSIEDTILKHAVDDEVGLYFVFTDVQQFLLHLC